MSVQQLGSIYERLLEHEPARRRDGSITIRPNPYVRKDSGSFYTPQELVDLILDHTLKPLAEERLKAFEEKAAALQGDPGQRRGGAPSSAGSTLPRPSWSSRFWTRRWAAGTLWSPRWTSCRTPSRR